MNWIKSIFAPFVIYLPLLFQITFLPWRFLRTVLTTDTEFEKKLHSYTFLLAGLYLIFQPYLIPFHAEPNEGRKGLLDSFSKEIFLLIVAILFSLVFMLLERKNKRLTLDVFLNAVLPIIFTAVFLDTVLSCLTVFYLEHLGFTRDGVTNQVNGTEGYYKLAAQIPGKTTGLYLATLIQALADGHFKALFFSTVIIGFDPLRERKQFELKPVRIGAIAFIYGLSQFICLRDYGVI